MVQSRPHGPNYMAQRGPHIQYTESPLLFSKYLPQTLEFSTHSPLLLILCHHHHHLLIFILFFTTSMPTSFKLKVGGLLGLKSTCSFYENWSSSPSLQNPSINLRINHQVEFPHLYVICRHGEEWRLGCCFCLSCFHTFKDFEVGKSNP